jgi:hypothetical protein
VVLSLAVMAFALPLNHNKSAHAKMLTTVITLTYIDQKLLVKSLISIPYSVGQSCSNGRLAASEKSAERRWDHAHHTMPMKVTKLAKVTTPRSALMSMWGSLGFT